jgi:hypothetical protein
LLFKNIEKYSVLKNTPKSYQQVMHKNNSKFSSRGGSPPTIRQAPLEEKCKMKPRTRA